MVKDGVAASTQTSCQVACDKAIWGPEDEQVSCFHKLQNKTGCTTTPVNQSNAAIQAMVFTEFQLMAPLIPGVSCNLDPISSPIEMHGVCTGAQGPSRCAASKIKCVEKLTACVFKCYISARAKNLPVDMACVTQCEGRFSGGAVPANGCFAKLEAKNPNDCLATDDAWKVQLEPRDMVAEVDAIFRPQ